MKKQTIRYLVNRIKRREKFIKRYKKKYGKEPPELLKYHIPIQTNIFTDIWEWITTGNVGFVFTLLLFLILIIIFVYNLS